jgi:hemoglobin
MATLLEELGGRPAVELVVAAFYEKVLTDPMLKGYFRGVQMSRLYKNQADFFCAALGQPEAYRGRDMRTTHAGMNIGDAEFDAVAGHLIQALAECGVDKPHIDQVVGLIAPLRADVVTRPKPAVVAHPKKMAASPAVCPVHAPSTSGWVWSLVVVAVIIVAAMAGVVMWQGGALLH